MPSTLPRRLRAEVRPMVRLALPVVLGEIGWVSMSLVDVAMVGRLDATAIGGLSIGRALFLATAIFGIGVLLALDPLVAQAFGAGRPDECRRWLVHGVYLSVALGPLLLIAARSLGSGLGPLGVDPRVSAIALPYLHVVSWSTLPLLLFSAFRRYLQALGLVRPVMVALLSANIVHVAGNALLIHGRLGFPALGAVGAAWSTVASSVYLALFLLGTIALREREERDGSWVDALRLEPHRLGHLTRLGLPAALQLLIEVAAFATVTALAGRLAPSALAAHQIALNAASFTFMVPLGISSAAAVRVGQALGRRDGPAAAVAGWTALGLGCAFMALAAIAFAVFPRVILAVFTTAADVTRAGVPLLYVAALFQLFDGLQIVATGALRGAGDTRTPMLAGLVTWWAVCLPLSYALCFGLGWGVVGLWTGLSVGLIAVGAFLVPVWARRAARFP